MNVAANLTADQAQQVIYDFLRTAYGLPDTIAKIITAQSGHETAGWTSNIYETLNNAFGFGYVGGGAYNGYNSIEDSVSDVVNWLTNKVQAGTFPNLSTITDPDIYAQALKDNSYYTDSEANYSAGISNWFNSNLQLTAGIGVAGLVAVGLLLYFLLKKKNDFS